MSPSEMFLGKIINQITESDLINYFKSEKKEGNSLEFKSYDSRENFKETYYKILSTICAYLNSEGGIIIWGTPKGTKLPGDKEESYVGDLVPIPHRIEPDSFTNKVASEIDPLCKGVSINPISNGQGGYYYVFEVIKSEFPPHQFDGTYYMRLEASTRKMPHQYIDALIKKISFPKLEGYLTFAEPISIAGSENILIPFNVFIYNQSYYNNEKNLQFRIFSIGCDVLQSFNSNPRIFTETFDKIISAKDILHKNMPYYIEYCLVTSTAFLKKHDGIINIYLSFWGEFSPIVTSYYKFNFIYDRFYPTKIVMIEKIENRFLFEKSDELKKSGAIKSLDEVHKEMAESWQNRIYETNFYMNLRRPKQ